MKKLVSNWFLALISGLCLNVLSGFASTNPNWTIDPHGYEYDMSMYVSVQRNGVVLNNLGDLTLAAFAGTECRGVGTLQNIGGSPYLYLRVRSHVVGGETITFRCYDPLRGVEDSVMGSVVFENLKQFGYPSVPYAMSLFIPVTNVSLNKDKQTLLVHQMDTLKALVLPADASDKRCIWSTSDTSIAVVKEGVVSALKAGQATISVKTLDGGFSAQCQYTVLQPVLGVRLNKEVQTLLVNRLDTLVATVLPADASNKGLLWSTDNDTVVVVNDGVVTALRAGKATITVKTLDGGYSAQCWYTVLQPVTGVQLHLTNLRLLIGQSAILQAIVSPANASNQAIAWASSNPAVASVSDGFVTAHQAGSTTITVRTEDGGWTANCQVYVPAYYQVAVHLSTGGMVAVETTALNDGDSLRVLEDSVLTFKLTPTKSCEIASVLYNEVDVTAQLQPLNGSWYFSTPPIWKNANLKVQFRLQKFELTLQDAESGTIGIAVEANQKQVIYLHPSVDWELYSVLMNGVEVIGELVQNTYTTPVLTATSTLQVILKKIVSIRSARLVSTIQLNGVNGVLTVKGAALGERIQIVDLDGRLQVTSRVTGVETVLKLMPNTVYLLKIGAETFKIAL